MVDGLSFSVAEGERLGLLGLSGSGKSMTVLALLGLLPAGAEVRSGTAEFVTAAGATVDLLSLPEFVLRRLRGREISLVFQEPLTAFNPVQRVGDQLREGVRSLLPYEENVDGVLSEWLARVELAEEQERILRSYPHELSGGQRQRLLIALALLAQPRLLLADEPTTALDVITEDGILRLLERLRADLGMASIFITHDLGVLARAADETLVLAAGREIRRGTSREMLKLGDAVFTGKETVRAARTAPAFGGEVLRCEALTAAYVGRTDRWWTSIFAGARVQGKVAIEEVSLRLRAGQWSAVIGPSGCGKTTLARCLTGLLPPAAGRIALPAGGNVQLIFQDPFGSLNPAHTVRTAIREILRANAPEQPTDQAPPTVETLLTAVHLPPADFADRYPDELSGGQRQRVAIARALAARPTVLIADEAVSALDAPLRREILDLLDELRRKHSLALLFITHDLALVADRADWVYLMDGGRIVEERTPEGLFAGAESAVGRALVAAAGGR